MRKEVIPDILNERILRGFIDCEKLIIWGQMRLKQQTLISKKQDSWITQKDFTVFSWFHYVSLTITRPPKGHKAKNSYLGRFRNWYFIVYEEKTHWYKLCKFVNTSSWLTECQSIYSLNNSVSQTRRRRRIINAQ